MSVPARADSVSPDSQARSDRPRLVERDLLAAIYRPGAGLALIPDELRRQHRIGRERVLHVLVALALHSNRAGLAWPSAMTLGEEVGLDRREARAALEVLEAAGLIERAGKQGRAIRWRLTLLDDVAGIPATSDPESGANVAGDVAGELAGIPATNWNQKKTLPPTPRASAPVPAQQEGGRKEPETEQRRTPAAPPGYRSTGKVTQPPLLAALDGGRLPASETASPSAVESPSRAEQLAPRPDPRAVYERAAERGWTRSACDTALTEARKEHRCTEDEALELLRRAALDPGTNFPGRIKTPQYGGPILAAIRRDRLDRRQSAAVLGELHAAASTATPPPAAFREARRRSA